MQHNYTSPQNKGKGHKVIIDGLVYIRLCMLFCIDSPDTLGGLGGGVFTCRVHKAPSAIVTRWPVDGAIEQIYCFGYPIFIRQQRKLWPCLLLNP